MNFLSPFMLLGLLGAALPIIIHLHGKRKAKVIRFAALDFLLGTDQRLAKTLAFRQVSLLIARVAVCLIIPLILSQPYASCAQKGPTVTSGPQSVVLIVDNSLSSGYQLNGNSLLSRSITLADEVLGQLGPEAEVALLTTTTTAGGKPTHDHAGLQDQLNDIQPSFKKADLSAALSQSHQLLEGKNHQKSTIYIFAWATNATFPKSLTMPSSGGPTIRVIRPIDDTTQLANTAITDLSVMPDERIGNRGISVIASVTNFSLEPITVPITLEIETKTVARGELTIAPGESQKKHFSANLSDNSRTANIQVRLADDALVADNTRYGVADVHSQIPVLLINGDPRTVRHDDELFYVEAALRPGDRSDSGTLITITTPDALNDITLNTFDVVILANAKPLPKEQVEKLALWVELGGGLLLSVGHNVDPDAYNQQMAPLLAQKLRTTIALRPGHHKTSGQALHLSKIETKHPIFSVYKKDAPGLYGASFDKVMLIDTTTAVNERRVLTRYNNGGAALLEAKKGKGRLLLFTSTLDRDWNNLAIHSGFLPFLQGSVRYLSAKPFQERDRHAIIGQRVQIKVSPEDTRIEIAGPNSSRHIIENDNISSRKHARIDSPTTPGFYNVQSMNKNGEVVPRPEAAFAVNIGPESSNLAPVSTADIEQHQLPPETIDGYNHYRRVELWHVIALLLLFVLLVESILSATSGRSKNHRFLRLRTIRSFFKRYSNSS